MLANILIVLVLVGGLMSLIYIIPQIVKLADEMKIVDLGASDFDRNSYSERD